MAGKKSQALINSVPGVGNDTDQSDYMFRFNRLVTGDHQETEDGDDKYQEEELIGGYEKLHKKLNKLVPPAGVPPPTAADLLKYKKKELGSVVDYCTPVEYINLSSDEQSLSEKHQCSTIQENSRPESGQQAGDLLQLKKDNSDQEEEKKKSVKKETEKKQVVLENPGLELALKPHLISRIQPTMAQLEGMYAPGNEKAHILPPAGYKDSIPSDIYRFNRACPYYPPDPCIRPNEGDFVCPPEEPPCPRNHPWMPVAGNDMRGPSDVFRFYKVKPASEMNPCRPNEDVYIQASAEPEAAEKPCPCANRPRYPPSKPARHFDYRYPSGVTDCTLASHRYGHAPVDCPGYPDPLPCWSQPDPSDCFQAPPNFCGGHKNSLPCGKCPCDHVPLGLANSFGSYDRVLTRSVSEHNTSYPRGMYAPANCGNQPVPPNTPEMYPREFHSSASLEHPRTRHMPAAHCRLNTRGAPDPYTVTGNLTYTSPGYSTSRECFHHSSRADATNTMTSLHTPCPLCYRPYRPAPYVCRPVYSRKYLQDCPEQDGPPADSYTFL